MDSHKKYDVFVSYRRRNAEGQEEGTHIARTIKLKLDLLMQNTDSCCFFDYSNMSNEDFPTRILKTIASAKVFVCVLTKNAMQRCGNEEDWVRREILQAKRCGLKIIFINPDGEFTGDYPFNFPKELDFVRTTNHLTVHTDSSFDTDLQVIYDEEIYPELTISSKQIQGALVCVYSDLECRVLDFGEEIAIVGEGKAEFRLSKGNHELTFVSVDCNAVCFDYGELDIRDLEYVNRIKVCLLDQYRKEDKRREEEMLKDGKGRNGIYEVGDYYDDGKKQGVVFEVTADGQHGKVVSLQESELLTWAVDKMIGGLFNKENPSKKRIGADDKYNGANNMAKVKQIRGWREKYPAFVWCADLGEGWYLPAIEELKTFTIDEAIRDAVNRTLAAKGKELANKGAWRWYWSSTEYNEFCAWGVSMGDGGTNYNSKYYRNYVRAVATF